MWARWSALGTTVVLGLTDPGAVEDARGIVEEDLARIDRACSRFRTDSDLSRVNSHPGRKVPTGPLLAEAIAVALRAARLTDGDVDPALGAALTLAGYDRDWALLANRDVRRDQRELERPALHFLFLLGVRSQLKIK